MAPTTDPALLIPLMTAEQSALDVLVHKLLVHLVDVSPPLRLDLEQSLGEARLIIAKAPVTGDEARANLFMAMAVERRLEALSMELKEPLVPRAALQPVSPHT